MRSALAIVAVLALGGGVAIRHLSMDAAEAEPVHTAHRQEIQSVSLDGRGLPMASLRALLTARPGQMIDTTALEKDRVALQAELEARGYLAAKVHDAKITYDDGAFVTFAIEQGPLFRVRAVTITGATEKDAGVVTIGAGEVATADRIRIAGEALAERLDVRGQRVSVLAHVHPDAAAGLVDIDFAATR